MKQTKLSVAIKATLLGASIAFAPAALSADKELLDILKANGAITEDQYLELSMANMMEKQKKPSDEMLKKMAWAGKIKIKGDLRVRQEYQTEDTGVGSGDGEDRQRYRARIGVYADVTDNVKAGVRLASAGGATSTNETLGDNFSNDPVYFDLAYINWAPVEGLELMGGKFKKPWQEVSGGLVWDGDVNPEGVALRYTTKLGGAKLIGTAGHLVLNDIDGFSFDEDRTVQFGQLAAKMGKTKLGVSIYEYDEDENGGMTSGGGNDSTEFSISEIFGETTFDLGLPIKLYGQYATNNDANGVNDGEDTAWLLGLGTKVGSWKASYDYRETELNAVNGAFNDSDFAGGRTDADGHRFKLSYKIDKNFSVGTTYFATDVGDLNGDLDVDTWQIDLKAKF
ncbi:MAG: hypothetical protein CL866_06760 [Cycloclasticus sp.]|nr:hypothetical protein [Cycloclasticus sp.]MBG96554.1 hypothetical protein [Cycloclasticus sp.]HAI96160.1 hypothetical protein [Methylococcaceae bacterium]